MMGGAFSVIGRPILAYVAASAAASVIMAVGITLGPYALLHRRPGAPGSSPLDELALFLLLNCLSLFGTTLATAAAPAIAASWIGRATAAPRPLTEIVFGAILGPLLMVGVMVATNDGRMPFPSDAAITTGIVAYFAAAGGVGGWVYALVVGRRRA
jgi:hypothetical protein